MKQKVKLNLDNKKKIAKSALSDKLKIGLDKIEHNVIFSLLKILCYIYLFCETAHKFSTSLNLENYI